MGRRHQPPLWDQRSDFLSTMKLPSDNAAQAALEVLERLRTAGHAAFLAGGCVRDMLLGVAPKDYDIATDAHPPRVLEIFPKSRMVGAKFGVVLVRRRGRDVEVATFRADGVYSDGRHPDSVAFGTEIDDAHRRDFTINGLFFEPSAGRVIDHVGGQADLAARRIRTIGDPNQRFGEDHLRMLRAVRFAARLGFEVDPATAHAIRAHARHLREISPERIWMELEQILTAPTRGPAWSLLRKFGLVAHLVRNWSPGDLEEERISRMLSSLPTATISAPLALAAMFRADPPAAIEDRGRSMRLSNRQISITRWLLDSLEVLEHPDSLSLADLKTLMSGADWDGLMSLYRADLLAGERDTMAADELAARAAAIPPDSIAPPPLLSGDQLSAMNMTPGPEFGRVLDAVYRAQLNEEISTTLQARELATRLMNNPTC